MFFAIVFSTLLLVGDLTEIRTMLRAGHYEEALRKMEAMMLQAPSDPEVQYQIGELLREQAASRAGRLEELAPNSAEAHELSGRSLEASGKLDEAALAYRAAISKKPGLPGGHFLLGNIFWKQRDFEAAKLELEAELRLNPNHALANLRLAQILLTMDEPAAAAEHLRKAVQADAGSIEAHQTLGKTYHALGDNSAALREFQIVAARRPLDNSVHFQLAAVYRALGQQGLATAELETHRRLLQEKADAARKASLSNAR